MSEDLPIEGEGLPGTVKFYERHLLVYTGRSDWPAHIEQDGDFLQALSRIIARHERQLPRTVKVTAIDAPAVGAGFDILVFPDQIKYTGLTSDHIPMLVQDQLLGDAPSSRLAWIPATDRYIFVCTHGERDTRCGDCGPGLRVALAAGLRRLPGVEPVHVHGSSHVGGHAYAGNLIIYPEGDWYGYVTTTDIPALVETVIGRGAIARSHWRGRLGLSPSEQVALARSWTAGG